MKTEKNGLTVYKASAGAGKTFTLAVEYIKLLVRDPYAYRHILAVTFTNKATGEMKERILGQLYAISRKLPEATPYLKRLIEELDFSEEEISKRAAQALQLLVHDYGRFRVETIDSFFQSVMRNLARELELSPNLNIELDDDKLLGEAVEALFRKLEPNSELMRWILDYIDEKINDDKRWNIIEEVRRFGKNLFDEHYMVHGTTLRRKLQEEGYLGKFRRLLATWAKELEEGFQQQAERFDKELQQAGLTPEELAGKSKGIASYFRKLAAGKKLGDKDIKNATLERALEDPEVWAAKTSPRRAEIIDLADRRFIPLLREAETYRTKNWKTLLSCRLSLEHLYKIGLLTYIDNELHVQNDLHNRFLLSETSNLLHNLVKEDDTSFVFEKTGTIIRHVMIDEFQDTSRLQWNNFRLLLIESLSQGAESMIVGDVKQSIYRWRGGDWEILSGLKDRFAHFPIREHHLTVNRRSEANVIDFNNLFFTDAVQILNKRWLTESGKICKSLLNAYSDVCQQSPKEEKRGHVSVTFLSAETNAAYETETLHRLLECIKQLTDQGIAQSEIAILLRYKKYIPQIAEWFSREASQYKLVSNEAFLLQASPAVNLLIVALRSMLYPDDTAASSTLAYEWQTKVLENVLSFDKICTPQPGETLTQCITRYLPEEWNQTLPNLYTLPLHELFESLFRIFSLDRLQGQDGYLLSFFDGLDEYLQNGKTNPEAFLRYWEETLYKRAIPAGEIDGIRILSIHASKGLEFHTVLIPFCDWELQSSNHGELVWCTPQEEPFNQMDLIPVNFSSQMADSIYYTEYEQERLQQWVDNLNLLYVAFTRTASNLIVWSTRKSKHTIGTLLEEVLSPFTDTENETQTNAGNPPVYFNRTEEENALTIWYGEEEYTHPISRKILSETDLSLNPRNILSKNENVFTATPSILPAHMLSLLPKMKFQQSNRSAEFITNSDPDHPSSSHEYINRGLLMHSLFSSICTHKDLQPALQRLLMDGLINLQELKEIERIATRALAHPQVQSWYDGSCRLYNECTILYNKQEVTEIRRPDRVMIRDGQVYVVDFKFGTPKPSYQNQVKEYMDLLQKMGYNSVKGYIWYVYKNQIEMVQAFCDAE